MRNIHVNLGKDSYEIYIENGLLDSVGTMLHDVTKAKHIAVISDDTVDGLYGDRLEAILQAADFDTVRITFPAGEQSKSMQSLIQLYAELAAADITRSDAIITFGGGVTGDLGGFAAATFLRGVPFIQIPTTIISQVDSSIGGKVAVDLPSGKNQAGAFYQPKAVYIDPDLLSTLPARFISDGLGEVIKYGCIGDVTLFENLEAWSLETLPQHWDEIIERCCLAKGRVVEHDVYDMGERMVLNFGHTIGHAIERSYGYGYYTHGEGVAAGMAMLTSQTEALGLTDKGTADRLCQLLAHYGLPTDVSAEADDLLTGIGHDKKKRGSQITLVVMKTIGTCQLLPVSMEELPRFIRKREAI